MASGRLDKKEEAKQPLEELSPYTVAESRVSLEGWKWEDSKIKYNLKANHIADRSWEKNPVKGAIQLRVALEKWKANEHDIIDYALRYLGETYVHLENSPGGHLNKILVGGEACFHILLGVMQLKDEGPPKVIESMGYTIDEMARLTPRKMFLLTAAEPKQYWERILGVLSEGNADIIRKYLSAKEKIDVPGLGIPDLEAIVSSYVSPAPVTIEYCFKSLAGFYRDKLKTISNKPFPLLKEVEELIKETSENPSPAHCVKAILKLQGIMMSAKPITKKNGLFGFFGPSTQIEVSGSQVYTECINKLTLEERNYISNIDPYLGDRDAHHWHKI